jgi:hypothetical protein
VIVRVEVLFARCAQKITAKFPARIVNDTVTAEVPEASWEPKLMVMGGAEFTVSVAAVVTADPPEFLNTA